MIAADLAERVRTELQRGTGIRATSRLIGVSTSTVTRIRENLIDPAQPSHQANSSNGSLAAHR